MLRMHMGQLPAAHDLFLTGPLNGLFRSANQKGIQRLAALICMGLINGLFSLGKPHKYFINFLAFILFYSTIFCSRSSHNVPLETFILIIKAVYARVNALYVIV